MKHGTVIAAFAALVFATPALVAGATADGKDLETRLLASDGWVAYHVPLVAGADGPCCFSVNDGRPVLKGCDLDGRQWNFGNHSDESASAPDETLAVYLRVERGQVTRVRGVGASCPVHAATPIRWIDPVDAGHSVAVLSSLLDRKLTGEKGDDGLVALAYHAGPSAMRALAARAEPSRQRKEREQAIFWLGQARGAEGVDAVEHFATTDADPRIRAHAIFVLSQSGEPEAYAHIVSISRNDPSEHVRGQALFWLAQMDDARAKGDIIASLNSEASGKVREQAVFALSQLDGDAADEALIDVLRGKYPGDVKKRALFWLGQSGSPRAMAYFDEALE